MEDTCIEDTHMEVFSTSNTNPEGSAISSTKTTSIVWQYITQNPDKFSVCNYCNQKFSTKSTTTTLKCHLTIHHSENLIPEANTPAAPVLFSQEHATKHLIKWIVCDLQPFTTMERLEFQELLSYLNLQYCIPSADHIKKLIMTQMKENKATINSILQDPLPLQQISGYYILKAVILVLQYILLILKPFLQPHTDEAIKETLLTILDNFGITTKLHTLVSDSVSNMYLSSLR
ncbi:LOW QUALITY PROTEIN: hypothetical protein BC937DRAFT_88332 [Endogone sp. FLAS-F59071]|nr:LOW QUALITY PROTEIN: hypothetical protein BC937DRAFT_88332 [Endogone sp. FLAS-F59071]|eukprot:RUS18791.1 LOW QUALITY PROTEIN: hypothetical protein BC937DRAFT_88332 [Endogone sp. FLAS-F59071]